MKILAFNKNRILAGLVLIGISTLVSCKKLIEIPANPPTAISREGQFADSTTTMSAVASVYTYNQGQGFAYSDANLTISTGLSADELSSTLNSDVQEFYNYNVTPVNYLAISLWSNPYKNIYSVNDILNGITNNTHLSASFIKQITGEMKMVRAFHYFTMVNLFGGVPLITSTDYTTTANIARATLPEVYAQISADLNDAVHKLPASYPSARRARPNLYTALALLAKVNLYQGKWQAAYNEADSVIKSGIYTLTDSLNSVYLDGSTEAIWQLPALQAFQATTEAAFFVPNSDAEIPKYVVTPFLLKQFEPGDQRRQNWVGTSVVNNQNVCYPFKYKNKLASASPVEGYMIFRLGEVLLIRAEAAANLNNLTQALTDVNVIRHRAGLLPSTVDQGSQTAVLGAVMKERQTEMCFEWGNRWFDLKRTGTADKILSAEKTGWQANAALYPLPQAQLHLNNLLKQNPGYH